ncbi:Trehalase precursor, putative [Pediculus humanus corporis]|uniref:Trehalase n=1 Tax=Pediculus humanus subsp. corporis TaxID=121224 RepID=E0VKM4_PEDHC|nr:Trehalase precursor, putative [Pediculus humanus corporis]EEB13930.1 Trehalase precursor, putative [Pediculus humanus corporis]
MNFALPNKAGECDYIEWNQSGSFGTKKYRNYMMTSLWVLFVFLSFSTGSALGSEESVLPHPCDNNIYCYGELLHTVQMAHLYPDSKTFVDMKLKFSSNETLYQFKLFLEKTNNEPTPSDLENFVTDYFDPAGKEFEDWTPSDWKKNPKFLQGIEDHNYRRWANQLHILWNFLGKKMKDDVKLNSHLYSILYVPYPVIVPGGRFREFYYWDSYWIIKGLILSEMFGTVKGMLENFSFIVDAYGHIPNGGRIYYLMRSHPPLFIPMVYEYLEATKDVEFLHRNLHILEKEFNYWMTNHSVSVDKNAVNYTLYRYIDRSQGPRPESYREDFLSASFFKTEKEKQEYYSELKAAAETGWDFSSRWFIKNGTNKGNLTDTKTKYIVPVDLNSILYWNAKLLCYFSKMVGNITKANYYESKASEILKAVTEVLWVDEVGAWLDYDLINEKERDYFFPTNMAPLWTGCYDESKKEYIVGKVMKYIQQKQIMVTFLGGVPTTFDHTNEQWDYPNAWPPLQHIVVKGLMNTGDEWAQELAYEIASRWVKSNFVAYNETGHMYEKYDATVVGGHGSGGEYDVQLGFGWTNGVVMDLLHIFGKRLSSNENDFSSSLLLSHSEEDENKMARVSAAATANDLTLPLVITAVIFLGIFTGGCIW